MSTLDLYPTQEIVQSAIYDNQLQDGLEYSQNEQQELVASKEDRRLNIAENFNTKSEDISGEVASKEKKIADALHDKDYKMAKRLQKELEILKETKKNDLLEGRK